MSQQNPPQTQSSAPNPASPSAVVTTTATCGNNTHTHTTTFHNPFPPTNFGEIPNNTTSSSDVDLSFHSGWHHPLPFTNHRGSIAASEVGEKARHTSSVDQRDFATLMEASRGMSPEEVARFLATKPLEVDGAKMMNGTAWGKAGGGYSQVTGAMAGTM